MGLRWAVAVLLLLLAPTVTAEYVTECSRQCRPTDPDVNSPTPIRTGPVSEILYAHWEFGSGKLLIFPPPADATEERFASALVSTGSKGIDARFFIGHASPGFVKGEHHGPWGIGLARDLVLAPRTPLVLYLYLEASEAAAPNLGVRASLVDSFLEPGRTVVAHGDTGTGALTLVSVPGAPPVYEFRIEIQPNVDVMPAWSEGRLIGYLLEVDVYQADTPMAPPATVRENYRFVHGPKFPTRILVPVISPLAIEDVHFNEFRGKTFVRFNVSSPFGTHDFNQSMLRVTAVSQTTGVQLHGTGTLRASLNHDGGLNTAAGLASFPNEALAGDRGPWLIQVEAGNFQQSFVANATAELESTAMVGNETLPGPDLVAIVLLFLAVMVLRRR